MALMSDPNCIETPTYRKPLPLNGSAQLLTTLDSSLSAKTRTNHHNNKQTTLLLSRQQRPYTERVVERVPPKIGHIWKKEQEIDFSCQL